jgi:antitoxin component of RelBE/YafQ-DinJ toxin-antitoxin module
MDFSTAMRTFLQQVILHKGLPYDVTLPNNKWSIEDETWDNLKPNVKEQFYESERLMQDKTAGMALNEAFNER